MKLVASNLIKVGGMSHSNLKGDKTLTHSRDLAINHIIFAEYHGLKLDRLILAMERTNSP